MCHNHQKVRIEVHNVHQVHAGCAACSLIPDNLPDDRYDVSVGIEEGGGIHQWCIPQNKTAKVGGFRHDGLWFIGKFISSY